MTSPARTRLSPGERRDQLLDLGVRLFARSSLEELSVDQVAAEAGISRGLLYHYFGDKVGFREAVVRRAAEALVEAVEPPPGGEVIDRLLVSVAAYVDWVDHNYEGYLSMVRGAATDPDLRSVYDETRRALTDLVFSEGAEVFPDTAAARLLVQGWQRMAEEIVLAWKGGQTTLGRDEVLAMLVASLPALTAALPQS